MKIENVSWPKCLMIATCADDDGCDVPILVVFKKKSFWARILRMTQLSIEYTKGRQRERCLNDSADSLGILDIFFKTHTHKLAKSHSETLRSKTHYLYMYILYYINIYTYVLILLQGWKHVESLMPTWRTAHNKRQLERLHSLPGLGSQVMQEWTAINCGTCESWMSEFTKIDWWFSNHPLAPINQWQWGRVSSR